MVIGSWFRDLWAQSWRTAARTCRGCHRELQRAHRKEHERTCPKARALLARHAGVAQQVEQRPRKPSTRVRVASLALLALLAATSAHAATPVRATYADVGVTIIRAYPINTWEYARDGHALDQTEMDARESFLIGVALPQLVHFLETIPGGDGVNHQIDGQYKGINKIEWNYRWREKPWEEMKTDRHYKDDLNALKAGCTAMARNATACAQSPSLTPGLLALCDLQVVGNRCMPGANPPILIRTPVPDSSAARRNAIRIGTQKPLTRTQLALLTAATEAHRLASTGANADVFGALFRFEASATSGRQLHQFRQHDFIGLRGSGWSDAEVAVWKHAQHGYWGKWEAAEIAGNWKLADGWSGAHAFAHRAMNLPKSFDAEWAFPVESDLDHPNAWPTHNAREWVVILAALP